MCEDANPWNNYHDDEEEEKEEDVVDDYNDDIIKCKNYSDDGTDQDNNTEKIN